MDFKVSKTRENLAKSFAAECQAGARYQFMATMAQNEKLFYVKDTMKMLAKNEMAHAKLFYDFIVDNSDEDSLIDFEADYSYLESKLQVSLKKEAQIEKNEYSKIYPEFARVAREEGFEDIAKGYEKVAKVELSHSKILEYLFKMYEKKSLYKSKSKKAFRCTNCGHLAYQTEGWKTCPLCSLDQGYIQIGYDTIFEECAKINSKDN